MLRWIKQWDPHVFGVQRPPAKAAARAPQPGRFTSPAKPWAGGRAEAAAEATRPEKQILLISGPPGLGKTTLAHVAARHAGYRPLEINASDERSAKVMRARVKEATDVKAVFGDRRPPLVVLDEIDGAMGGTEGSGAINSSSASRAPAARAAAAATAATTTTAPAAAAARRRRARRGCSGR